MERHDRFRWPWSLAGLGRSDRVVAAMQMIEDRHELGQIELVFLRKARLPESMIGIPRFPVVRGAKGYSREVRRLLPKPPEAQDVRVGRFDNSRPAADSRTDHASKRPNPSQILRASFRTPPRP